MGHGGPGALGRSRGCRGGGQGGQGAGEASGAGAGGAMEVPGLGRHIAFGIDGILRATRSHSVLQDRSSESTRLFSRQPSKITAYTCFLPCFQFLYLHTGPEKATGDTRQGTKRCGVMLLGAQGLRVGIFYGPRRKPSESPEHYRGALSCSLSVNAQPSCV